ncbi:MAG: hypothetical protein J0I07_07180 [Myxococcales bacterium]|nr:hypothetical protein [Myxococcales bacterium]
MAFVASWPAKIERPGLAVAIPAHHATSLPKACAVWVVGQQSCDAR